MKTYSDILESIKLGNIVILVSPWNNPRTYFKNKSSDTREMFCKCADSHFSGLDTTIDSLYDIYVLEYNSPEYHDYLIGNDYLKTIMGR